MAFFRKLLCLSLLTALLLSCSGGSWKTASREPAGIAPDPKATNEAVLMVFGAPTWGWRGWFAIHTWVAAKHTGASDYTVFEVIGWKLRQNMGCVRIERDAPDRYWYGERPVVLAEKRGEGVDSLIDKVEQAARDYPWPSTYEAWPGPNSNTFTAFIAKNVPELGLKLPYNAIGKGYLE